MSIAIFYTLYYSNPIYFYCPHVFKIPYYLFARILLLQYITTPRSGIPECHYRQCRVGRNA